MVISRLGGGGGGSSEGAKFYIKVDVQNVSIATLYAKKDEKIFSESYTGSTAQIEVDDFGTYAVYAVVNGEKTDEISVDVTTQYTAVQTITVPLPTAVNDLTVEAKENVSDPTKADFIGSFTKPSDVTKVRVYLGESASVSDTDYIRSTDCSEAESFIFGGYQKDKAYYFVIYTENKFGIKAKGNVVSAVLSEGGFAQWVASRDRTKSYTTFAQLEADEIGMRELMTVHASQDILVDWLTNTPSHFAQFASSRIAMKWIGLRDRVFDKLIEIPSVKSQILASTYCYTYCLFQSTDGIPIQEISGATSGYGRLLNESVPVMTDNDKPLGQASASKEYDANSKAYKAFDNNDSTSWDSVSKSAQIWYKFPKSIRVKQVKIKSYEGGGHSRFKNVTLKGSSDGITYTPISTKTFDDVVTMQTWDITEDNNYKIFMIDIADNYISNDIMLSTLQFYGVSYSEEEFGSDGIEMLYDNGVKKISFDKNNWSLPSGQIYDGQIVEGDDNVKLTPNLNNNKWSHTFYGTSELKDLTDYKFIRIECKHASIPSNIIGLDINSVNESTYIGIQNGSFTNGSAYIDLSALRTSSTRNASDNSSFEAFIDNNSSVSGQIPTTASSPRTLTLSKLYLVRKGV